MIRKNMLTIKNRLLSSSILIGLAAFSVNVSDVEAGDYNYNNNSPSPINGNLIGTIFTLNAVSNNLTFNGTIITNNNHPVISNNDDGLWIINSIITFNNTVTANSNRFIGLATEGS